MPQSTLERRERWGVTEERAMQFLKDRGYKLNRDWSWSLPSRGHQITPQERDAAIFLIEEWDMDGIRTEE